MRNTARRCSPLQGERKCSPLPLSSLMERIMETAPDALDIVQSFQDSQGWTDATMVLLLTDYINAGKDARQLHAYLELRAARDDVP